MKFSIKSQILLTTATLSVCLPTKKLFLLHFYDIVKFAVRELAETSMWFTKLIRATDFSATTAFCGRKKSS